MSPRQPGLKFTLSLWTVLLSLGLLTFGAGHVSWWVWILVCCLLWVTVGSVLGEQKFLTLELETLHFPAEFHVAEFPVLGAFSLMVGSVREAIRASRGRLQEVFVNYLPS